MIGKCLYKCKEILKIGNMTIGSLWLNCLRLNALKSEIPGSTCGGTPPSRVSTAYVTFVPKYKDVNI